MITLKNRRIIGCVLILILVALEGCKGEPLPADKKDYAGNWANNTVTLKISPAGEVSYKKEEGSMKTTINAPITEFDKDDFIVGFWIFTTTFEVEKPPFKEGDRWAMVVDGNKLYKVIESSGATEISSFHFTLTE
jgi:hypothetical protein